MTTEHGDTRAALRALDQQRADTLADAEIRRALDDCTPGKWTTCLGADLYVAVSDGTEEGSRSDVLATIAVEHTTSPRQTADAWLMAQGKAHAAEVLRLREEIARLRTIVDGRAVPPTIREARQHSHVTRGAFVAVLGDGNAHCHARIATGLQRFDATPQLWIALDTSGRPCAWPVVDGGESREGEER